jgi:hypothetical protein
LHRDLGRWNEAVAAIREYQNAWPPRNYEAAREFALCAAAVSTRKQSVTSEVETQRRRFTDLAVAELRELLKRGSKNLAWLRWDPSLTTLRTDARFLQLVQE